VSDGDSGLPLQGLRVLDLSRILAGPFCGMVLGDLGADVIKVEHPRTGDDARSWGPPFLPGGESAYFASVNKSKRSIGVDLGDPAGRDILSRLIIRSDVVIENFRAGTLARWGFGPEWFTAEAPRTIRTTVSGYGSFGPRAGEPGYDFILQAESGLMAITGDRDGAPVKLGVAIVDLCTGMLAAIASLAALEERHRTERGRHVEVSLHDTGIQLLANVAGNFLATASEAGRYGSGHPSIVPYRTFETSDGWLALAVGNDAQFARLAELLGHPEWAHDDRYARNPARVRRRDEVDQLVGEVMQSRTRADWLALLKEAGIPSGSINRVSEALTSEHATAREIVAQVDHVSAGLISLLRLPIEVDGALPPIRRAPPTLGQHTDEILELIGISSERRSELAVANVVTAG
jgi:succinate--hydroxymethylglutarate CoA-transferase